jgi:hypothetical protein
VNERDGSNSFYFFEGQLIKVVFNLSYKNGL